MTREVPLPPGARLVPDVGYWNGIVRLGRFDDLDDVVRSQSTAFPAEIRLSGERPSDLVA